MKQLFLGLALLSLGACKKDAPEASLPAATQAGFNTGGCLLDGQPFVAAEIPGRYGILSSTKPIPPITGGFLNDSTLRISLNGIQDGRKTYLSLFVRYQGIGTYRFNQATAGYGGGSTSTLRNYANLYQDYKPGETANDRKDYTTNGSYTGSITLTKANPAGGVLAGQFEFTAFDSVHSKSIVVSLGRFDYL